MNILLVCTGNTCRSPLAEALLVRALGADAGAHRVSSAGTSPWEGAPASEGSYLVALEAGLDLSGHRARKLTREMVADADLILTMSRAHQDRVEDLGGRGKSALLGVYAGRSDADAEVPDPMGGALDGYREVLHTLDALTAAVAARLRTAPAP
jgi:protein-tyrosine phosphatase